MACKPCPDCQTPVSKIAVFCPACGRVFGWTIVRYATRAVGVIFLVYMAVLFVSPLAF